VSVSGLAEIYHEMTLGQVALFLSSIPIEEYGILKTHSKKAGFY
jgi:hypothetical protein